MATAQMVTENLMKIEATMAAMFVDSDTGMVLAAKASHGIDPELAAAGNTRLVQAQRDTMRLLGIAGDIDDVLITLDDQYHIIYPIPDHKDVFGYVIVAKSPGMNIALARKLLRKELETYVFGS